MVLNEIINEEYELIFERVLSFLDPASVAILGSCNKKFRNLVNSSLIWHKFCLEKKYEKYHYLVELPNHSCIHRTVSASPIYSIPEGETLEKLGFWREVYNRAEHLLKNWRNGIYAVAPILKGHKGKITAFDSDGTTIVSGSREAKEIKIWSIDECECVNTIKIKTDSINCCKIYKDQVIVAGEDGILRIYDYEGDLKYTLTNNLTGTGSVNKIIVINDKVLGFFSDKSIKAWSLATYDLLFILRGHSDDIECVQSFENFLITGSWDKTLILWDVTNGYKITKLVGHAEVVNCIKMKEGCIVSGSSDNFLRIWNLTLKYEVSTETSKNKISLESVEPKSLEGHTSDVNCLEFYGDYIASGSSDSSIIIWNFNGDLLYTLTGHLGNVRSLYMDEYKLVSGGDAKKIMIWDYKNGNLLNVLYRNPNKLNTMIVNDTKIITESPELGSNITIICYW